MPDSLRDLFYSQGGGFRGENRVKLLKAIVTQPANQKLLSKRAGLSQATVTGAVRELRESGRITVTSEGQGNTVRLAPVSGALVGVELGFQSSAVVMRRGHESRKDSKVGTVDAGAVHDKPEWPRQIAATISSLLEDMEESEVAGIALGVPGSVSPQHGQLARPLLYPWTQGDDPGGQLTAALTEAGVPVPPSGVLLENDANLAALAESVYEYPEAEVLFEVMASTGTNGGLIIDGKPFRGRAGSAVEIGHISMRSDGDFCPCGGRGCLETIVGGDALLRQVRTGLGLARTAPDSLDELVEMASGSPGGEDGDVVCRRVLTEAAGMLGWVTGSVCNVLNPKVVVLGGVLGKAKGIALDPFRAGLRRSVMRAVWAEEDFTIAASDLPHAVAHGALVLAVEGASQEGPVPASN